MSIHACTECGGKVSTLAASCPHCGSRSPARNLSTLTVKPEATSHRELSNLVKSDEHSNSDAVAIARIASLRVICHWISVACFALAIALIVYPAEKSFDGILKAIFEPLPGYGYGWVGLAVKHWPSCVLIVIGKIASNNVK